MAERRKSAEIGGNQQQSADIGGRVERRNNGNWRELGKSAALGGRAKRWKSAEISGNRRQSAEMSGNRWKSEEGRNGDNRRKSVQIG